MRAARHVKFCIHLLVLSIPSLADGQYFQRTYGWGPFNTAPAAVYQANGHFGLLGSFSSSTSGQTDFVLMQTDSNGVFEWAKAFGSSGVDNATSLIATQDNGYLLGGFTNGFSSNNDYDGYLVRTDSLGDTLWTKVIGTNDWDFLQHILPLSDGNFLITGSSEFSSSGLTSGWTKVISPSGGSVSDRFFSIPNQRVHFEKAAQAEDSTIYICGYIDQTAAGQHQPIVYRLDYPSLDTMWSFIGDTSLGSARFNGIALTRSGNPVVCGQRIPTGRTDQDMLLCKLDIQGDTVWTKIFGATGIEYLTDIMAQGDSVVCSGTTNQYGAGNEDFYLIRFRPNGSFQKGSTFGSSEADIAYDILPTKGNRITAFGTTRSYGPGIVSMMIIACDDSMNYSPPMVVETHEIVEVGADLQLFPNPTQGILHFSADNNSILEFTVAVHDLSGRELWKTLVTNSEIDLRALPSGVYILRVYKEEIVRTFRVVVAGK
ncbi:MAG: T9SS type A sorting domain-containing protein [Bacteroidota bacterium]